LKAPLEVPIAIPAPWKEEVKEEEVKEEEVKEEEGKRCLLPEAERERSVRS
jgi:hypothetical protein